MDTEQLLLVVVSYVASPRRNRSITSSSSNKLTEAAMGSLMGLPRLGFCEPAGCRMTCSVVFGKLQIQTPRARCLWINFSLRAAWWLMLRLANLRLHTCLEWSRGCCRNSKGFSGCGNPRKLPQLPVRLHLARLAALHPVTRLSCNQSLLEVRSRSDALHKQFGKHQGQHRLEYSVGHSGPPPSGRSESMLLCSRELTGMRTASF
mmetsp:Transcript_23194/g.57731  ORF Transcript_23194/g.57731 Transcript_23194/m.57731 type:complete len:205 (+) Transcript_23194:81-695(+)